MQEVTQLTGKGIKEVVFFDEKVINNVQVFIFKVCRGKNLITRVTRYFRDGQKREEFFKSYISEFNEREEAKKQRKANEKLLKEKLKEALAIGTILTCSWGYEQTNVDFYIVTSLNKNKTKIEIQEIGQDQIEGSGGFDSCYVLPNPEKRIGEVLIKGISRDRIKIDESVSLRIWDGQKKYRSWYY